MPAGESILFTGQCDCAQEELPLRSLLDVTVLYDTGDDRAGEDTVGKCDLCEFRKVSGTNPTRERNSRTKSYRNLTYHLATSQAVPLEVALTMLHKCR